MDKKLIIQKLKMGIKNGEFDVQCICIPIISVVRQ